MPATALSDTTVLEVSDGIAGAFCGRLLAQYGAEVIKVEPPVHGDRTRRGRPFPDDIPHPERRGQALDLNPDKRGGTLGLAQESGRQVLRRLVAEADGLIESSSPGAVAAVGLAYADLAQLN